VTLTGEQRLELTITGYQFPQLEHEEYDSNWLLVCGIVTHATGKYMFHDACLLTYELRKLHSWLESLACTGARTRRLRFSSLTSASSCKTTS